MLQLLCFVAFQKSEMIVSLCLFWAVEDNRWNKELNGTQKKPRLNSLDPEMEKHLSSKFRCNLPSCFCVVLLKNRQNKNTTHLAKILRLGHGLKICPSIVNYILWNHDISQYGNGLQNHI